MITCDEVRKFDHKFEHGGRALLLGLFDVSCVDLPFGRTQLREGAHLPRHVQSPFSLSTACSSLLSPSSAAGASCGANIIV